MSTLIETQAEALLSELRGARRRALPFAALGVIAALIALVTLTWLVIENRRQATEIEQQKQLAQSRLNMLDRTLRQLKASESAGAPLVKQAIAQATAADEALNPGLQVLAQGVANGWDVDLFWCAGSGEAANYAAAQKAGGLLASEAQSGRAIAAGIRLGRVRMRPVREQDRSAWPAGFYAVSDGGKGEDAAADAIATFLATKQSSVSRIQSRGNATPFYVSIFACN